MRVIECRQGTEEWLNARLGIPTASNFGKILTPTGKPSAQAETYMHQLIAERLLRRPVEDVSTPWMERGTELEESAVRFYELQRDVTTERVGFVLEDGGRYGCSPDRLVGFEGGLEVKCPSAAVHVGYLLESLPDKFKPQVQGQLLVTGRQWCDLLSFNPDLPPALVRIPRDEKYIADLAAVLQVFCRVLDEKHAELAHRLGMEVAA